MSSPEKTPAQMATPIPESGSDKDPEWADGLKQLYDSVLDEPLPDAFADLLAKLDGGDAK